MYCNLPSPYKVWLYDNSRFVVKMLAKKAKNKRVIKGDLLSRHWIVTYKKDVFFVCIYEMILLRSKWSSMGVFSPEFLPIQWTSDFDVLWTSNLKNLLSPADKQFKRPEASYLNISNGRGAFDYNAQWTLHFGLPLNAIFRWMWTNILSTGKYRKLDNDVKIFATGQYFVVSYKQQCEILNIFEKINFCFTNVRCMFSKTIEL